jgi:phosphoribosylanthranilate isomerase
LPGSSTPLRHKCFSDAAFAIWDSPLRIPVHREDLTGKEVAAIIKSLAPPVFGLLITYLDEASEIAAFRHALGARIVQLHGNIDHDELKRLKTRDRA